MAGRTVVIPIHGTFDTSRSWTFSDSSFSSALMSELGGELAIDDSFSWSGKNKNRDRLDAAAMLAEHIQAKCKLNDDVIILVGHSHGGTIALHAAHEIPSDTKLGIVTLATPFLCGRRPGRGVMEFLLLSACLTAGIPIALLVWMVVTWPVLWIDRFLTAIHYSYGIAFGVVVGLFTLHIFRAFMLDVIIHIVDFFQTTLESIRTRVRVAAKSITTIDAGFPLLCLHVKKDEVHRWFNVLTLVSKVVSYPLHPVLLTAQFLLSFAISLHLAIDGFYTEYLSELAGWLLANIGGLMFFSGLLFLFSWIVFSVCVSAVTKLVRGHRAGFDSGEALFMNWAIDMTANLTPKDFPKSDSSRTLGFELSERGIHHSNVVKSEAVAIECRKWIESLQQQYVAGK